MRLRGSISSKEIVYLQQAEGQNKPQEQLRKRGIREFYSIDLVAACIILYLVNDVLIIIMAMKSKSSFSSTIFHRLTVSSRNKLIPQGTLSSSLQPIPLWSPPPFLIGTLAGSKTPGLVIGLRTRPAASPLPHTASSARFGGAAPLWHRASVATTPHTIQNITTSGDETPVRNH